LVASIKTHGLSSTCQAPDIARIQQILGDRLGVSVDIKHCAKGKLVISYNSLDELDGILTYIK